MFDVSRDEALDAVVDSEDCVSSVDAVAHEGSHGGVHAASGRADVHYCQCVAFLWKIAYYCRCSCGVDLQKAQ